MSDISLQLTIKEESSHLFKRCIRKLLEATFILRDRDEKLFSFISRESNRQDISEYLRMIGFDILVDEKTGVGMLIASEEDSETVGLKRANVVTFTTLQYHFGRFVKEVVRKNRKNQDASSSWRIRRLILSLMVSLLVVLKWNDTS